MHQHEGILSNRDKIQPCAFLAMHNFETYLSGFTSLPLASMQALLDLFTPFTMPKGDHLAVEGELSKKLAFVKSGVLRAYYRSPKGEEFNKLFFVNQPLWARTLP